MIKEKLTSWGTLSAQIGRLFAHLPFRPNTYTWLTVIVAVFALFAIIARQPNLGLVLFLVAGLFDIIDGGLARHLGIASASGAFLDGSLDRFVDFAVIFSYFWLPITPPWLSLGEWITIAVFVAIMPSFEVAYANHRKAVDDPQEIKIWRILNRGEMYPLMLAVILASNFSAMAAGWILVSWLILATITTFQTLYIALKLAQS